MISVNNSLRTLVLVFATSLISFSGFGQVNFQERTLNFLQSIAFESTYDNIVPMFKTMKVELAEKTINENKTEILYFKISDSQTISLLYSENKKFIYASMGYRIADNQYPPSGLNKIISDAGFVQTSEATTKISDPLVDHYNKKDYPYEFTTRKIGRFLTTVYIFNKEFGALAKYTSF